MDYTLALPAEPLNLFTSALTMTAFRVGFFVIGIIANKSKTLWARFILTYDEWVTRALMTMCENRNRFFSYYGTAFASKRSPYRSLRSHSLDI